MVEPLRHFTVFNTNAGSFYKWEVEYIHDILNRDPSSLEGKVVITNSIEKLERVLEEFKDEPYDILGIGGGDATFSKTVTLVDKIWGDVPKLIAPYSSGTINNWPSALNLSDGIIDKIKKKSRMKSTKPIQLAEYIADCAKFHQDLKTEELDLLDINGQKGLNIGFGIVPKLLWSYYGKSPEQYQRLEEELAKTSPERYHWELKKIWDEQDLFSSFIEIVSNGDLLKRTGVVYALSTVLSSAASSLPLLSKRKDFLQSPIKGDIYIDGKKFEPSREINGIYISTYDSVDVGIKKLTFYPAPEAREEKGKMQVVISTESLPGIVSQMSKILKGKHLKNIHYFLADEFRLESKHAFHHIEGDFEIKDYPVVKYDRTLKVISPFNQTAE